MGVLTNPCRHAVHVLLLVDRACQLVQHCHLPERIMLASLAFVQLAEAALSGVLGGWALPAATSVAQLAAAATRDSTASSCEQVWASMASSGGMPGAVVLCVGCGGRGGGVGGGGRMGWVAILQRGAR